MAKLRNYSVSQDSSCSTPKSDLAGLVSAARDGDRNAFVALHSRYAPMVHAIVLSRAPESETEDIVQEVFVEAMEGLTKLKKDGSFGSWLAAIARNRAARYHRRPKLVALPTDLEAAESRTGEALEVIRIIQELPETYCETLIMRLVEGMTGPEIAERTGMKPGSVRVNLHRGMQLLRKILTERGMR